MITFASATLPRSNYYLSRFYFISSMGSIFLGTFLELENTEDDLYSGLTFFFVGMMTLDLLILG